MRDSGKQNVTTRHTRNNLGFFLVQNAQILFGLVPNDVKAGPGFDR